MRKRFGSLARISYNLSERDMAALRSGELDPDIACVYAPGVPEPTHEEGIIIDVDWRLDLDPPCAFVTFWVPGLAP